MIFSPRIGLRELAGLSRRLALALEAGIDVRRVFQREAGGSGSRALRANLGELQLSIAAGHSLTDALARTGEYFPPLFREMIEVGEESGHLTEVLRQLAEHYEYQLKLRRAFLASLAWPAMQLFAAVMIVGLLIWILGLIGSVTGSEPVDMLGLGLVGNRGVVIYFSLVGLVVLAGMLLYAAARRSVAWTWPLQRLASKIPVLGPSLQTLALARLAWALHLTLGTGMSLRKALPLCLRSTGHVAYMQQGDQVVRTVTRGEEISEALARTGTYPAEFLEQIEVGEQSGRLPEAMATLSTQYREHAQRVLGALTMLAGFAVWGLVALLIIIVIVRLFMFYVGTINEALNF